MNVLSKGALAAMTLALDFAAGSALEQLLDAAWFAGNTPENVSVDTGSIMAPVGAVEMQMAAEKAQSGGGVCKPTEHSVMVMEIDRYAPVTKILPKHVCIRALSGEYEITAQLEREIAGLAKH